MHSALFLLLTLVSVAVLFLQQDAALVAIIQIVVYASAIVVLFLFVITLLGVDQHETFDEPQPVPATARDRARRAPRSSRSSSSPVNHWVTGEHSRAAVSTTARSGNVKTLAKSLFTDYIWAFEMTAVLLVIAVVGGVVARAPQRPPSGAPTASVGSDRDRRRPSSLPPTTSMLAAVLFTIGAVGLLVRRNTLVMFMCIELMLNAANLTFVSFAKALERHRRPGDRVLHARRRRGRGRGRASRSSSRSSGAVSTSPPTTSNCSKG